MERYSLQQNKAQQRAPYGAPSVELTACTLSGMVTMQLLCGAGQNANFPGPRTSEILLLFLAVSHTVRVQSYCVAHTYTSFPSLCHTHTNTHPQKLTYTEYLETIIHQRLPHTRTNLYTCEAGYKCLFCCKSMSKNLTVYIGFPAPVVLASGVPRGCSPQSSNVEKIYNIMTLSDVTSGFLQVLPES